MNKSTTVSNIYCNSKYNYLIITPAVSIDQNYDNGNANYYIDDDDDGDDDDDDDDKIDINLNAQNTNNNNNLERQTRKSQNNRKSESMVILNQRSNLMPKRTRSHSWRWCTLLCSAIKCFGNSTGFSAAAAASVAANSTSYTNNNIARNFVSSDNNVFDLIVTNETHCKKANIPYDL